MRAIVLSRDIIGGALVLVIGLGVTIHSASFAIGSLSQMGPGFFPMALGLILTAVGIALAVRARISSEALSSDEKERRRPEWKAWMLICLGVASFVMLAKSAGLVVATFCIVFISALGDRDNSWRSAALLAIVMVAVSITVFWWGLKIQLPLFGWGRV